ncbi:MAG: flagellum-specific ATP synthase [Candidatus Tokpelaia sp. JSC188]|nr:MAG: flagellum-specific ATP synthase [Candidatus Tokpelaia sp. JSC188]
MDSASNTLPLAKLAAFVSCEQLDFPTLVSKGGIVVNISRAALAVRGLSQDVSLGDTVLIDCIKDFVRGEIIHINEDHALVKPYDEINMPVLNASVFPYGQFRIAPDISWRGRVINALGEAIDNHLPLVSGVQSIAVESVAMPALKRTRVDKAFYTGVNVIDIFTPLCFGQRMGIFAGSGVGKSTLLAMMTRIDHFETVVLALVGERGREVREMLDGTLSGKRDKVITVVATSDESPMMRRLAPVMATTIAEYFAACSDNVLLIVDSITRYALAAREVAIAAGEPPVSRGFPPSVFSQLPRLLERAGPGREGKGGSITGIYAVLVDGDDHNDPIADTIRGTLDGHIVLDRAIAEEGRFPAVDIPASVSRLAPLCWTQQQQGLVQNLKEMISRFEETRDLRAMGAYKPGSDVNLDQAVRLVPLIYAAMQQKPDTPIVRDPYADLATALKMQDTGKANG